MFPIDTSNYPTISGKILYDSTLSSAKFYVNDEDGLKYFPIFDSNCGQIQLHSIAISIDNSGSTYNDYRRDLASDPLKWSTNCSAYIYSLLQFPPFESSIIYYDDSMRGYVPWTQNKTVLDSALNNPALGKNNDFYRQLMDPKYGLLQVAAKGKYAKRDAILFTDAVWGELNTNDVQQCIAFCRSNNITFHFVVTTDKPTSPWGIMNSLQTISFSTGGKYFYNIINDIDANSVAKSLVDLVFEKLCSWHINLIPSCHEYRALTIHYQGMVLYDTIKNPFYNEAFSINQWRPNQHTYYDTLQSLNLCDSVQTNITVYNKGCGTLTINDSILIKQGDSTSIPIEILGNSPNTLLKFYIKGKIIHDSIFYHFYHATLISDPLIIPDSVTLFHDACVKNISDTIDVVNMFCRSVPTSIGLIDKQYSIIWNHPDIPADTTFIITYSIGDSLFSHTIVIKDDSLPRHHQKMAIKNLDFDTTNRCYPSKGQTVLYNHGCLPIKIDSVIFSNQKFLDIDSFPLSFSDSTLLHLTFDPQDQDLTDSSFVTIYSEDSIIQLHVIAPVLKYRIISVLPKIENDSNNWNISYFLSDSAGIKQFRFRLHSTSEDLILMHFHADPRFHILATEIGDSIFDIECIADDWVTMNKFLPLFTIDGAFILGHDSSAQVVFDEFKVNEGLSQFTDCIESVLFPSNSTINYIPNCGSIALKELMYYGTPDFKIVPNPATNNITFYYSKDVNIRIYDAKGEWIETVPTNELYSLIHLQSGIYFAVLEKGAIKFIVLK